MVGFSNIPFADVRSPSEGRPQMLDSIANRDRERFMSRDEVVGLVGLTYPTVWRMMSAGTFPPSRKISERRLHHDRL
jgi:predicted DNA-binding transcriptional regulator AlpA